jgi:hypothetical protein
VDREAAEAVNQRGQLAGSDIIAAQFIQHETPPSGMIGYSLQRFSSRAVFSTQGNAIAVFFAARERSIAVS